MRQAPKKNIPKNTLTEVQRQGQSGIANNISSFTSQVTSRIYGFLPSQFRWLMPFVGEDIKDAIKKRQDQELDLEEQLNGQVKVETAYLNLPTGVAYSYDKYRCQQGNPLICDQPRQTVQDPEAKFCTICGFPALLRMRAEIQGKSGRYRITRQLGYRGMGRLYEGVQLGNEQPVIVKEYLLPKRYFNQKESVQAKKAFESLGGLNLADGRVENSRLISPTEAIADRNDQERCYLVTKGREDSYPTLRVYLVQNGPMSPRQVRHLLNQVLQSLESLHGQKFRFPTGQIQPGLAHGNLNLDSLLISPQKQLFFSSPQFLVYLCDLNLWERRFDPPPSVAVTPKLSQDLIGLGYVSFYLLAGRWVDSRGEPLNPQSEQYWPTSDRPLKHFIFRLLELEAPFESAEAARQALLGLPTEELEPSEEVEEAELAVKRRRLPYWFWWLLAILALLGLVAAAIWWWGNREKAIAARSEHMLCCIKDVSGIPSGKFTYTAESNGIWTYVLQQKSLIEKNKTLEAELVKRRPQLKLTYLPEPTGEKAIAKVHQEQVDFAITSLVDNLTDDLEAQEFAYDGLVIFVAFSYERRDKTLPKFLNGQITFEQLRQLYTGKITNWQDLGGPDLPVRLYMPTETETVRIFEQRVLKSDELIAQFRQLWQAQAPSDNSIITQQANKIIQLSTLPTLRTVLRDFEDEKIGGIGFGPLSKVFGQCSVYPLAIVDANHSPVQPLSQDIAQPIDPATDLCNNKGSYRPNIEVFQTRLYPLAYPLAVIYPRDNSRPPIGKKFAEILKTTESQHLLSQTGLVPLQPLK